MELADRAMNDSQRDQRAEPLRVSLTDSMIWRSGLKELAAGSAGLAHAGEAEQAQPSARPGVQDCCKSVQIGAHDSLRARRLGSNADLGHSSASAPHDTPVMVEPVTPWEWLTAR